MAGQGGDLFAGPTYVQSSPDHAEQPPLPPPRPQQPTGQRAVVVRLYPNAQQTSHISLISLETGLLQKHDFACSQGEAAHTLAVTPVLSAVARLQVVLLVLLTASPPPLMSSWTCPSPPAQCHLRGQQDCCHQQQQQGRASGLAPVFGVVRGPGLRRALWA